MGVEGSLAVVTAGWQEREEEVDELAEHVRRPVTNLRLYGRAEELFASQPKLFEAYRERQNFLRRLQRVHRLRLDAVLEPARRLLRRQDEPEILEEEQRSAEAAVRALDHHHLKRLRKVHQSFHRRWGKRLAAARAPHEDALRGILEKSALLAVAGGHVAVLLNRLRLFAIDELAGDLPIIAWSAGAMALGEKVVLFHDRPPQGAGNAEILDLGLGMHQGVLPLPHARARLRLEDPVRVGLLARRFAPSLCVALDQGAWLRREAQGWTAAEATLRLWEDGRVVPF
jgi:hypothetical protein